MNRLAKLLLCLMLITVVKTEVNATVEEFTEEKIIAVGGTVEDFVVDESHECVWVLRKALNRVEAYGYDGQLQASVQTGLEPSSLALTYDGRFLGVGSLLNQYMTVIDTATQTSIGTFNSLNHDPIYCVTAIGESNLLFITRPDSFGSPPLGGIVYHWDSDTQTVQKITREGTGPGDYEWGAQNFLFGLRDGTHFLITAFGFSQGGTGLISINHSTHIGTVVEEHLTNVFLSGSSMHGFDGVAGAFVMDNDYVKISDTGLEYQGPLPYKYSDSRAFFSPVNSNRMVLAPVGASQLDIYSLVTFQPVESVQLPSGHTYRGKGQFNQYERALYALTDTSSGDCIYMKHQTSLAPTSAKRWSEYK